MERRRPAGLGAKGTVLRHVACLTDNRVGKGRLAPCLGQELGDFRHGAF